MLSRRGVDGQQFRQVFWVCAINDRETQGGKLISIPLVMTSQCSERRRGETGQCFGGLKTIRAALFWLAVHFAKPVFTKCITTKSHTDCTHLSWLQATISKVKWLTHRVNRKSPGAWRDAHQYSCSVNSWMGEDFFVCSSSLELLKRKNVQEL